MRTIRTTKQIHSVTRKLVAEGHTIALVPTMGFLHEGHLSLIRRAKKEADVVITTIFVNPTQFALGEDLAKYPRDEKGDIKKIKSAGGDIVFIPDAKDIYPDDFQTYVDVEKLTVRLEGKIRPGHFRGVTTIVAKLYNLTRPDVVVFGMKDFQQAVVLKQMTRDLGYPIKYIVAPTVRESDGLAMSSRNKYLIPAARQEATCLYLALTRARELVKQNIRKTTAIAEEMRAVIKKTCPTAEIDYIGFNDFATLADVDTIKGVTVCSLAVRLHGVRLIDNVLLKRR
jgi:pantoate--beta-alanine ligase